MSPDVIAMLTEHGVQPSAQRVAVAKFVLTTAEHPTAERVFNVVRETFPWISRATVYNTLNLFVEKGLLKASTLTGGRVVFDANVERHHHLIDESSGTIHDIPWESIQVCNVDALAEFDVSDYQVVMRGTKRRRRRT